MASASRSIARCCCRKVRSESLVAVLNYDILVNRAGRRFFDEGADKYECIDDDVTWTIMRQKAGITYLIFYSRLYDNPSIKVRIKTEIPPYRSTSVADLTKQLDVPERPLALHPIVRECAVFGKPHPLWEKQSMPWW